MKTHILYVGLILAVGILGALVGSSLLAPAGAAVRPEDGKGGVAAPVPPGPAPDILSQEPKLRHTLQGPSKVSTMARFSLAFTADGKTLVGVQNIFNQAEAKGEGLGGLLFGVKGWVKLWDVATGKEQASSDAVQGGVSAFALTADGKTLARMGYFETKVNLRDVVGGKERGIDDTGDARYARLAYLAFTPDGKTLAVGCKSFVKLWDVSTGKERACLKPCGPFCRLIFSADGKLLASVSDCLEGAGEVPFQDDGEVTLWDVATGEQRDLLPDSGSGFLCAAFSPDGKTLAAGGAGVVLWDVATCQKLATLKAHKDARKNNLSKC